jgi:hypothetical protein
MADLESPTAAEPPIGRLRTVTAIGFVALSPLGLIVLGHASLFPWAQPYNPPYVCLLIGDAALVVRSAVVIARWTVVGPGEARDRFIWGAFYLFCVGIFLEWTLGMGAAILVFDYAFVTAFYWNLTRRTKKAEPDVKQCRVRFDLSDLIVALVLFSLATAAGAATFSKWTLSEPLDFVVLIVFAIPVFGFIGLIGFLVDAGLRDVTNSTSKDAKWTCLAIGTVCSLVSIASYIAPEMFFFALPAFVAMYVLTAIMQESLLVAAGMRVEQTWVAPSDHDEKRLAEKQPDREAGTEESAL